MSIRKIIVFMLLICSAPLFNLLGSCKDQKCQKEMGCQKCCGKLACSKGKVKKKCVTIPSRSETYLQPGICDIFSETVPEAQIYVRTQGKFNRRQPTIVFVHGLGETSDVWKCAQQELSTSYYTVSFDLRGFGRSSKTPPAPETGGIHYTSDLYANDIFATLQHFGVTKNIILVSHSLGGNIGLKFASLYQDQLQKLVLVSAPVFVLPACNCNPGCFNPSTCENDFCYPFGLPDQVVQTLIPLFTACDQSNGTSSACDILSQLWYNDSCQAELAPAQRAYINALVSLPLPILLNMAANLLSEDFRPLLPTIHTPTLICYGSNDIIVDPRNSLFIHYQLPNSILAEFADFGHQLHVVSYKNFDCLLREFITSCKMADLIKVFDQGCCVCPLAKPVDYAGSACSN